MSEPAANAADVREANKPGKSPRPKFRWEDPFLLDEQFSEEENLVRTVVLENARRAFEHGGTFATLENVTEQYGV